MEQVRGSTKNLQLLSELLLTVPASTKARPRSEEIVTYSSGTRELIRGIVPQDVDDLKALAITNHVIMRSFRPLQQLLAADGNDAVELVVAAVQEETACIDHALGFLEQICAALDEAGCPVTVIKSLDHWPDLGSDLDLYSNAAPDDITRLMKRRFNAEVAPRSWGDRLAQKKNFTIPGLPEAVEIHMGRLGQTGEQVAIASRLSQRTRRVVVGNQEFRVTSSSDRILISTLQRMYRHFYFRLCDVVDSAALADSGGIDYEDLREAAKLAGIWEGTATYLVIVSDYVRKYRGSGLDLPQFVLAEARFGGEQIYYAKEFLRVPIMPQSAKLYGSQLAGLLRKREIENGARLSLLPWLATAALVGQKITGSDKGIW